MQENINKYGTTLHHPEHQLNEINTLAHCPPPQTAKIFHSRVKDGLIECLRRRGRGLNPGCFPGSLRLGNPTSDVGAGFKPARVRIALPADTGSY